MTTVNLERPGFRSCDRLVPRWLQDRSKSAPGGVLGRLGRGLGPLLGAFGPSLDGLGRVLDRLEGSLEVVLSSFWSSLIRFIVSTSWCDSLIRFVGSTHWFDYLIRIESAAATSCLQFLCFWWCPVRPRMEGQIRIDENEKHRKCKQCTPSTDMSICYIIRSGHMPQIL